MSTQATVHFEAGGQTEAIIYRHHDGYPKGLGRDVDQLARAVGKLLVAREKGDRP